MSPLAKGCSSIALLLAVVVALFIFGMRSCLSKYDERIAMPPALYFKKDSAAVIVSLVKYSKATSYSTSNGFTRKSVSNTYYIQSNDAVSGDKISGKEITGEIKHFPEKMLGSDGRNAWVFMDELLAFDAFSLQKVADIEIIEAKNPSLSGMMPLESNFYRFDEEKKAIIFTSNDGAQWQLDSKTLIASVYEPPVEQDDWSNDKLRLAKDLEQRIKRLRELNPGFSQLKINQDTINGTWWGLYSKQEMATLSKTVSFSPAHQPEQRRQLYTGSYDSISPVYIDFKNPLLLHSAFYLDGGFLADKETAMPVHLAKPGGFLLLYKTVIGDAGEIIIGRIDTKGTMLWQLNTGLKKWIDYMLKDNRLIVFANNNNKVSSSECTLLLIIDLNTGKANRYDYFDDEVKK